MVSEFLFLFSVCVLCVCVSVLFSFLSFLLFLNSGLFVHLSVCFPKREEGVGLVGSRRRWGQENND